MRDVDPDASLLAGLRSPDPRVRRDAEHALFERLLHEVGFHSIYGAINHRPKRLRDLDGALPLHVVVAEVGVVKHEPLWNTQPPRPPR